MAREWRVALGRLGPDVEELAREVGVQLAKPSAGLRV